ncbi:MAG: indole-3-glycerol phosphate synthase TrpC [Candidatus Omnitrophota bacterium]
MEDALKQIVVRKKERLAQRVKEFPRENLLAKIEASNPALSFIKSINKSGSISLIAEAKKASPSRGVIRQDFNPCEIARIYKESGAQAISVVTCEDYFLGDINYAQQIKKTANLPVLRKDFIIDPYQIYEARAFGCDAVLLIAELLNQETLSSFLGLANSLNLDCLVEVNTEKDIKKALKAKAGLIGINNRNLHSLAVDFETTQRLYPLIPRDKIVVVESGIKSYQDILFLKVLGVSAVLIGEAIVESADIKAKIKEIMGW